MNSGVLPQGLTPVNTAAGCYRFEEEDSVGTEADAIHFTVYGDGSIDIQAVEMSGITTEALEWIVNLAKQKRKAAFDENS